MFSRLRQVTMASTTAVGTYIHRHLITWLLDCIVRELPTYYFNIKSWYLHYIQYTTYIQYYNAIINWESEVILEAGIFVNSTLFVCFRHSLLNLYPCM